MPQPIETAPKDGSPFLGWSDEPFYDFEGDTWRPAGWMVVRFSHHNSGKDWWQIAHYNALSFSITHWLPLPGPPA